MQFASGGINIRLGRVNGVRIRVPFFYILDSIDFVLMDSAMTSGKLLLSGWMLCVLIMALSSCGHKEPSSAKGEPLSRTADPIEDNTPMTDLLQEAEQAKDSGNEAPPLTWEEQHHADSLEAMGILASAIGIADEKKNVGDFTFQTDSVDMEFGNVFARSRKHLYVRVYHKWTIYHRVFRLRNNAFEEVLADNISMNVYRGDTIRDVNGDGRLDLLRNWYPASGCCLRDISDVYLQKRDGSFTSKREFINPVFFPKEKAIRGLCYGHFPAHYKYKWRGYEVDTVEFIHCPRTVDGVWYRNKSMHNPQPGTTLKDLPREYKDLGYGDD